MVLAAVALLAGVSAAPASSPLDGMIGILSHPVPTELSAPMPLIAEQTGIDCYTLPCPYWRVTDPVTGLIIGVERVTAAPDDWSVDLENALNQRIAAGGYAPIDVIGYVVDRPRPQGSPEFQRILVVTDQPDDGAKGK